jgi:magnesium-transporting ATPase (P-type)
MNIKIISIVCLCMVNFLLLFNRKSLWFKNIYKWYIVTVLFLLGLVLIYTYKPRSLYTSVVFSCLMAPAIYSLIDLGFQRLSLILHHRDFYLWLKGSADIRNKETEFKASDRIFSLLLLYIVIALPVVPLLIIKLLKELL